MTLVPPWFLDLAVAMPNFLALHGPELAALLTLLRAAQCGRPGGSQRLAPGRELEIFGRVCLREPTVSYARFVCSFSERTGRGLH